jgi:hypothetical protein
VLRLVRKQVGMTTTYDDSADLDVHNDFALQVIRRQRRPAFLREAFADARERSPALVLFMQPCGTHAPAFWPGPAAATSPILESIVRGGRARPSQPPAGADGCGIIAPSSRYSGAYVPQLLNGSR